MSDLSGERLSERRSTIDALEVVRARCVDLFVGMFVFIPRCSGRFDNCHDPTSTQRVTSSATLQAHTRPTTSPPPNPSHSSFPPVLEFSSACVLTQVKVTNQPGFVASLGLNINEKSKIMLVQGICFFHTSIASFQWWLSFQTIRNRAWTSRKPHSFLASSLQA